MSEGPFSHDAGHINNYDVILRKQNERKMKTVSSVPPVTLHRRKKYSASFSIDITLDGPEKPHKIQIDNYIQVKFKNPCCVIANKNTRIRRINEI